MRKEEFACPQEEEDWNQIVKERKANRFSPLINSAETIETLESLGREMAQKYQDKRLTAYTCGMAIFDFIDQLPAESPKIPIGDTFAAGGIPAEEMLFETHKVRLWHGVVEEIIDQLNTPQRKGAFLEQANEGLLRMIEIRSDQDAHSETQIQNNTDPEPQKHSEEPQQA